MESLTPAERAVLAPRTVGQTVAVESDGASVTVVDAPSEDEESYPEGSVPEEVYFWDRTGYLVVEGVMDDAWCATANAGLEYCMAPERADVWSRTQHEPSLVAEEQGTGPAVAEALRGTPGEPFYALPEPYGSCFRRLIANPPVVQRLNWMAGAGVYESDVPRALCWTEGMSGQVLHAGGGAVLDRQYAHNDTARFASAPFGREDSNGLSAPRRAAVSDADRCRRQGRTRRR